MRDVLSDYERLSATGEPVGRAVVTNVWGSGPRPPGACLLATAKGAIAGSVSGGCVEGATVVEIQEAMARRSPKLVEFGVTDETAWGVGLACGGTIQLLVEPSVRPEVLEAARQGDAVTAVVIEGAAALGATVVVRADGSLVGPLPPLGDGPSGAEPASRMLGAVTDDVTTAALDALRKGTSRTESFVTEQGMKITLFLEVHQRQPRLLVFGGVHIAASLVSLARTLGYHTIVADGRSAFLTRSRFPDADELVLAWPEEAFRQVGLDTATYVCVLSHDPKFDEPALEIALRSPAAYVGAIGSRKTQAARRERLRRAGLTEQQLSRLRGPIGLDLGGRHPSEIALAILAEITALRHGRLGPEREASPASHRASSV